MNHSLHPLLPEAVQEQYWREGLWPTESLIEILLRHAEKNPDAPLYLGEEHKTYGEMADHALRFAGFLHKQGITGDKVVVAPLVGGWEATVVVAAVAAVGAKIAPLPRRASRTQVKALIEATDAHALVISSRLIGGKDWHESLKEFALDTVVLTDSAIAPDWAAAYPTVEMLSSSHEPVDPIKTDLGAPFLFLSTGGTTGPSKVVLHSMQGALYAADQYAKKAGLIAEDRILSMAPFGHASGTVFTLMAPIIVGASVLPLARWNALEAGKAVLDNHLTWTLLSGTHIYDLLQLDEDELAMWSTVRGLSAGSGSDERYLAAEKRLGLKIQRMYGLTECMGHALMPIDAADDVRMSHDGLPFDGVECHILSDGEAGEYLVRSPSLMLGYYRRPELTEEAVTADGYLHTGDVMSISREGYVRYVGRLKDVIRRGGVNIDPLELERILVQHPDILDVTVVGMPHPRMGEKAVAVVVPVVGAEPTLNDLTSLLAQRDVPPNSFPEAIVRVATLPKTEYGKHNKTDVKKELTENGFMFEDAA